MVREDGGGEAAGYDRADPPSDPAAAAVPVVQQRGFRGRHAAGVQEVQRVVLCGVRWAGGERAAVPAGDPAVCAAAGPVLRHGERAGPGVQLLQDAPGARPGVCGRGAGCDQDGGGSGAAWPDVRGPSEEWLDQIKVHIYYSGKYTHYIVSKKEKKRRQRQDEGQEGEGGCTCSARQPASHARCSLFYILSLKKDV